MLNYCGVIALVLLATFISDGRICRLSSVQCAGSSKRKSDDDEGAPKRPSNAFCYFMQAQKDTMAGTFSVVRVMRSR